jgi:hypothetical protein
VRTKSGIGPHVRTELGEVAVVRFCRDELDHRSPAAHDEVGTVRSPRCGGRQAVLGQVEARARAVESFTDLEDDGIRRIHSRKRRPFPEMAIEWMGTHQVVRGRTERGE